MSLLYVKILSLCLFFFLQRLFSFISFFSDFPITLYSESFYPLFLISILLLCTHTVQYLNSLIYLSLEPQLRRHFLQEFQLILLGQFPPFCSPTSYQSMSQLSYDPSFLVP